MPVILGRVAERCQPGAAASLSRTLPSQAMKARIWGCRGSLATPGPETVRYGGNTSCLEVRARSGAVLVLDAGTGIRRLGISLMAERPAEVHLLLTHMHLDHVEGLGFFAPLFDPECSVRVWGPRPDERSLEERIAAYVSPPLFPVPFERIPATITFTEVWDDEWEIGGVRVMSAPVRHPGRTVGYRISENGNSVAFVPDNEPALEPASGLAIAADADVLFHDAQYTAAEYETRVGWGHSALPDFARFVGEAVPGKVVMFHHDPSHSDDTLEEMVGEARSLTGRDDVELAREGLELVLG
jgi:phosphoribosyl 1,2-cyclic phosphodiesterase